MSSTVPETATSHRRQRWLSILAKAPTERLATLWDAVAERPAYTVLRRPEIGLVMVKGRVSGSGVPFCAGEMTVTRAAVRLASGEVGLGYVGGRHPTQAEIVAVIDALGQCADWQEELEETVIAPLEREAEARHRTIRTRAAATKVEFFTVAREAGT